MITDIFITTIFLIPRLVFALFADITRGINIGQIPDTVVFVLTRATSALSFMDPFFPSYAPGSAQFMAFVVSIINLVSWLFSIYIVLKIISIARGANVTPE